MYYYGKFLEKRWKMKIFEPKPHNAILTIPNIITSIGILLLVPYVWGFLAGYRWPMMISLVLAGTSDLFDGLFARKLKQQTRLGELIDPMRDRLLLLAVLIHIVYLSGTTLLVWLGTIFGIEWLIILLNLIKRLKVHLVGKLRQAAHLLFIGLALLSIYFKDVILYVISIEFEFPLETAVAVMTFFSLIAAIFYLSQTAFVFIKNNLKPS